MLRFFQRLNHRDAVRGNLDALLMMYPRKRQFERDFPALKATIRTHFGAGVEPPSSALQIATSIIEGFLLQLTDEEKRQVAEALTTSDLHEVEMLAERRIGGESDQKGDNVFFATRLCGVALLMAGKMASVGAVRQGEYQHFASLIERELGAEGDTITGAFTASARRKAPQ
jgi:hypothetical protein